MVFVGLLVTHVPAFGLVGQPVSNSLEEFLGNGVIMHSEVKVCLAQSIQDARFGSFEQNCVDEVWDRQEEHSVWLGEIYV